MAESIGTRISSAGVTKPDKVIVIEGSKDHYFLSDLEYGSALKSSTFAVRFTDDEEEASLEIGEAKKAPDLEDIELIQEESIVYINENGLARAQLVFKVRNTSGGNLLGVDVRVAQT